MRLRIPLFILLVQCVRIHAQAGVNFPTTGKTDSLIQQFMATWNIKGGSVAITKNGKLIYNKGFGYADAKNKTRTQPNSLYRIASVSKPITAIAIMKLVEEGRLSLSDTVFGKNKILDQPYYLKVISDKRLYTVTVQQLLEHTAGWDRNVPVDGYSHSDPAFFPLHVSQVMKEPNPVGDSTLIKFMLLKGLSDSPGTHYSYSNIGYLVLGKVIEKISGMSYEKYVTAKILRPLGISDIRLGKNLAKDKLEREVNYFCDGSSLSCYGDGKRVETQYGGFNLEAMNAHGGWVASAQDLTKLLLAVDGTGTDIIKPSSLEAMDTPGKINPYYAKGWSTNKMNNYWHTGSIDGSATFVCRTYDGYTWVFLFNSRADNSSEFWNTFDKLPRQCIKALPGLDAGKNDNKAFVKAGK
jgi:CubicO group peptidase (beta-lactamase class C family)